jgi:hypothetical protein
MRAFHHFLLGTLGLALAMNPGSVIPGAARPEKSQGQSAKDSASAFREEVIGELTPGSKLKAALVGATRLVFVEEQAGKRTVRLDGKPQGGAFDDVSDLTFSRDELHFAFFGKRGSSWFFVLDGQEHSPGYTKITSLSFQPDANSYAYGACQEKKCQLFVDGAATGNEYQDISYPKYSVDGKHLAFLAKREKKWIAIVDSKELPAEMDDIWGIFGFTRDASRFYVAGRVQGGWTYLVDSTAGPAFDVITPIAFSSDLKHYAYGGTITKSAVMKKKTLGSVVLDGQSIATYEGRGIPGGGILGQMAGSFSWLTPGVRSFAPDFNGISTPEFDREGKLVYAARRDKGDVAVFVGDQAGPGFDEILSAVAFTEDSQHFAYVAKSGKDFVVVRDNHPGATLAPSKHEASDVPWIAITKDNQHLAFETVSGGDRYQTGGTLRALRSLVLDGVAGPEYDVLWLADPGFDKDMRHFWYSVHGIQGNHCLINVDGHESRTYDDTIATHLSQDGNTVTSVALDGGRFLRVTYALGTSTGAGSPSNAP